MLSQEKDRLKLLQSIMSRSFLLANETKTSNEVTIKKTIKKIMNAILEIINQDIATYLNDDAN